MAFTKIKALLHESIGLHADSVGQSSIERAIGHRMRGRMCENPDDYYNVLISDPSEIEELIEEVVVPETWFFRNSTPFDVLVECVSEIRDENKKNDTGPVRILSVPCSTGEEPYSIAMALSEAGFADNDYHIDAIDISKRALAKARRAIYGRHSFREQDSGYQEKYFEKITNGWQLSENIRSSVSFEKGNIITGPTSYPSQCYDIIFCRNLLIYFTRETQLDVLEKLSNILKHNGVLFVGHAETGQVNMSRFSRVEVPRAFAFRKTEGKKITRKKPLVKGESVEKLKSIYDQLVEVTKKDIELSKKIQTKVENRNKKSTTHSKSIWVDIERLINDGKHSDASILCEEYIKNNPENADAYYYLGLISNLEGSVGGAESLLKKAIYLSPNHQKALSLSAYLAEKRGDTNAASLYRRREKNARSRNS